MLLVEDNAGWHRSQKVQIPSGIEVEFLPPYSPELQPAERLWKLIDEPLVNECFESLDEIEELLIKRCNILSNMKEEIRNLTNYHWLDSV
ncbi:MAG: transposase [Lyngbya sp.]|nr:transposase [Lyngbya sp.]